MIRTLIRKQLLELLQSLFIDRKNGKARTKKSSVFFMILFVFMFVGVGLSFYSMANGVGMMILGKGNDPLFFAIMGLISIALGVFGSVFSTYASLYLPKDNEVLMALPIPPAKLLIARLSGVYLTSLLYTSWVWIPSLISYWTLTPLSFRSVICPFLLTFVIALFVTVLTCVLGWLVALIVSRAKNKSFLTVLLSVAFLGAYFAVYSRIISSMSNIVDLLGNIGTVFQSRLQAVMIMGRAAAGEPVSFLLFTLFTAVLAAACVYVLSKTFMRAAFVENTAGKKTKKEAVYTRKSRQKALLNREFRHFTSLAVWMLNGGLGLLFLPVLAIGAAVKKGVVREALAAASLITPELVSAVPIMIFGVVGILISMNTISAASVSLEGQSLRILQSLPVGGWEILQAKERMDVILNAVPALFAVLILGWVLQVNVWNVLLLVCAVGIYLWLKADFGLMLDLLHPNLTWTNPVFPVKQSFHVMVALFGGWLLCVGLTAAGIFAAESIGVPAVLGCYSLLLIILLAVLRRWLKTKGAEKLLTL